MIDLRKLRMLEALERLGTVAAVAAELHQTAPGVSMQLASLEKDLGLRLTERQGRRLVVTPAGRELVHHARGVLDRLSLAESEIEALRQGVAGTYRLAAFPSAARTFVADAWRTLLASEGSAQLRLTTPEPDDAVARLATGGVDLAVIHSYSMIPRALPEGVEAEELVREPVWIAMRADDPAAADAVDLATLAEHPWVVPAPDVTCYAMVERACGQAGFQPRVIAESMDFAVQLELVAAGVGVALVPGLTVARVPDGVVFARPVAPVHRHIHAARRASLRGDAGLRRLSEVLRRAAEDAVTRLPGGSAMPAVSAASIL